MNRDFVYLARNLTKMHERITLPDGRWTSKAAEHMELLYEISRETLEKILYMFRNDYVAFGYDPHDAREFIRQWNLTR